MTIQAYQHDILIMDRSGSISDILAGMQDGFREFCASQAALEAEGIRVTGSLWQFDDEIECLHSVQPVTSLASYRIIPRGMTALFDAVGMAITAEGAKLAALPEDQRPGQVLCLVSSDGKENHSREYAGDRVAAMIEHQRDAYKWKFVFIGTNQDVFKTAGGLNIGLASSLSYAPSSAGAQSAWRSTSAAVGRYTRSASSAPKGQADLFEVEYSDSERGAAKKPE